MGFKPWTSFQFFLSSTIQSVRQVNATRWNKPIVNVLVYVKQWSLCNNLTPARIHIITPAAAAHIPHHRHCNGKMSSPSNSPLTVRGKKNHVSGGSGNVVFERCLCPLWRAFFPRRTLNRSTGEWECAGEKQTIPVHYSRCRRRGDLWSILRYYKVHGDVLLIAWHRVEKWIVL